MDIFEKQQTIEAIKLVLKARWFYVLAVVIQIIILRILLPTTPLPSNPVISLVILLVLASNLGFWFYLRLPPEKISSQGLKIIKGSIIIFDQLAISTILYFSGTANKMLFVVYFVIIMLGASLYKARGVILATLLTSFLYTSLVLLEYYGLMPPLALEAAANSPLRPLKGNLILVKGQLIGFNLYLLMVAIVVGYLAKLFRSRERSVILQRDELVKKTDDLEISGKKLEEYSKTLEQKVKERTGELEMKNIEQQKINERLQQVNKVMVGREKRIVELKKEIEELKEKVKNDQGIS